jgi:hypothetical protein
MRATLTRILCPICCHEFVLMEQKNPNPVMFEDEDKSKIQTSIIPNSNLHCHKIVDNDPMQYTDS